MAIMPQFPLGTVLFPAIVLPLHVFEPRYRQLIRDELARDGRRVARWNLMHADQKPKKAYITEQLESVKGPVIAATDYIKCYVEQLRQFVPRSFSVLGTDGFGRSDTRSKLRHFFEVDRYFIVIAALKALADEGAIKVGVVIKAIKTFEIDVNKLDPMLP